MSQGPVLCIDIGNTTCRGGIWLDGKIQNESTISTVDFKMSAKEWLNGWNRYSFISYCSVVPKVEKLLLMHIDSKNVNMFGLTAQKQSFLPIQYPKPEEIGSDRIANCLPVYQNYQLPSVVIDLGTATTFDVVTQTGGYVGGVILPGPQGMLDYLGNKTALLPSIQLSESSKPFEAIGKDTQSALISGVKNGYLPMLNGVLKAVRTELEEKGETIKSIIQTGGESKNFQIDGAIIHPSLTLEGLALAFIEQQSRI